MSRIKGSLWTSSWMSGLTAALGALTLAPATYAGEVNTLVCDIRGGQVVAPVTTAARGCGTFTIDTNANTLSFYIVFEGVVQTASHIHGPANPGQNAGVVFTLPAGSPKIGTWNYPQAMEADILGGRMYVNIHSAAHPGGEIRGQIAKAVATLDALQEVPPVACPGAGGWGVFVIDICANTLSYHIVVEGALCGVETGAHIHGTVPHTINAAILHALPLGSPKIGTWNYPEALESDILQGLTYVNVHSTKHPGGVIRGQITQIVVPIDGTQQVPPVTTPAAGTGFMSIDKDGDRMGFYIQYGSLSAGETAAHIHGFAPPGQNAGILFGLPASNPKVGLWSYGATNEAGILDGRTYINIHTATNPGGEIRGQINIPDKKPQCPWDLDCDGVVGVGDLLTLFAVWGSCAPDPPGCLGDFNNDGFVGVGDMLAMFANWGPC